MERDMGGTGNVSALVEGLDDVCDASSSLPGKPPLQKSKVVYVLEKCCKQCLKKFGGSWVRSGGPEFFTCPACKLYQPVGIMQVFRCYSSDGTSVTREEVVVACPNIQHENSIEDDSASGLGADQIAAFLKQEMKVPDEEFESRDCGYPMENDEFVLPEGESPRPSDVTAADCSHQQQQRAEFKNHRRKRKPRTKRFTCNMCETKFALESELRKHQPVHTGERAFECSVCGQKYKHRSSLVKHSRTHTGERPFKCQMCDQTFAYSFALQKHTEIHSERSECPDCSKTFITKSGLMVHQKKIHLGNGEPTLGCSLCDKRFFANWNLSEHQKVHTGIKPHECTICGRNFAFKSGLRKHMRSHTTQETPYHCVPCGTYYAKLQGLQKHRRIHHQEDKP